MANYCTNRVTIRGSEDDVKKFKETAYGVSSIPGVASSGPSVFECSRLLPIPQDVLDQGEKAACQWTVRNWGIFGCGVGWPKLLFERPGYLEYEFDTRNCPAEELIQRLSVKWPKLTFVAEFWEDMLNYEGVAIAWHGQLRKIIDTPEYPERLIPADQIQCKPESKQESVIFEPKNGPMTPEQIREFLKKKV